MESWREELYASDYGSQYLMHYRTKGSKNGISRTAGYRAIGQLAGRERDPSGQSASVSRRGKEGLSSMEPVSEAATGLNRPTKVPAGKTSEEPKPNGWPEVPAGQEVDLEKRKNEGLLDDDGVEEPNGWPEVPAGEEVDLEKRKAEQAALAKKKQAQSEMKKIDKVAMLDKQAKEAEASNPELIAKKAAERAIEQIKNESFESILKDYASIAGDIGKLLLKYSALNLATAYGGDTIVTEKIYDSMTKDAKSLGRKIGTRKAKNQIRRNN